MLKLYIISVLLLGVISRDRTGTRTEHIIIGRSRNSSECDRYDVVPAKTIINLSSDGYIINPACSLNLIGFRVNDETLGSSGMCYEILEMDIPCGDRNVITIQVWPVVVYQNKTSTYVVVNDTVPLLKESFTCIYRRQKLDEYCFNGITMYEISMQRTTDDPSIKHSLTIRTSVAADPLYQEINPRNLNKMFVVSNECQCDGPVCKPCKTETHLVSTYFVDSQLNSSIRTDKTQTPSSSFDMNNLITVIGGIICAILTPVTAVILKRYHTSKDLNSEKTKTGNGKSEAEVKLLK